jgi:hypothetical protein
MKPKRGRPFLDLSPLDLATDRAGENGLFLKRFDAAALAREFREAGIFARLASRGYEDVELRTEKTGGEHRLRVLASGESEALIDLRLVEESRLTSSLVPVPGGMHVLSVLSIQWLEMQDPRASFTLERPQLPGQRHPGLRLTRPLILRIHAWATAWGKDAVLNVPEYFHNAVFYAGAYRFLSAARQGRFEALRRDLAGLSVAAASAAVEAGCVMEEPAGRPFLWEAGEMVSPLSEPVRGYLESSPWRSAAMAARDASHFHLAPAG